MEGLPVIEAVLNLCLYGQLRGCSMDEKQTCLSPSNYIHLFLRVRPLDWMVSHIRGMWRVIPARRGLPCLPGTAC